MRIFGWAEGTPKSWADTNTRKIGMAIPLIVESFRINFVVEREQEEQQRLEEARRAHMAHRQELSDSRKSARMGSMHDEKPMILEQPSPPFPRAVTWDQTINA